MKILFLVVIILLSGCDIKIQAKDIKSILDNYCLNNGSVNIIEFYGSASNLASVTCNDGALYEFINLGDKNESKND